MKFMMFNNRTDAGQLLAEQLSRYKLDKPVVLALPRGGVPVGFKVAQVLEAPLSVLVSRKIGAPNNPEFGIGAISEGGVVIFDQRTIGLLGVSQKTLNKLKQAEQTELDRRIELYRQGQPLPELRDKNVILVDDGLATGVTAQAAIKSVKKHSPASILFAAPVCAPDTANKIRAEVDLVLCTYSPTPLRSIGQHYRQFEQISNDKVIALLKQAKKLA
ncbi:MAG: phosphoribosyltransferase [Candidatus Pacebacteria bacterium]|nr:phosphoribosyltransferase [Candidatus Paceibacterota bacterium]